MIVNAGTAAGAGIITAAHVIGRSTHGLATVATIFPLPNGGGLKLTTRRALRQPVRLLQNDEPDRELA